MGELTPAIAGQDRLQTRSAGFSWVSVFQIAVLSGLILLIYQPVLQGVVHKWATDGNWSHGWLVPVFSLYFLVVHRQELLAAPRKGSYAGVVLLLGALSLLYLSYLRGFGYPQPFSLIPCLMGLVLLVGGWGILKVAWFPIAFLICAIPLPQALYFDITHPLRRIASRAAGTLLGLLPDVETEVAGVVIDYSYGLRTSALNVEDACSGMRLMMAFCTLGIAMAYLGDRPLWQRVIMIACCVPIAVICNAVRVVITGVLHIYGYEELSQGTAHGLIGLAMLPLALGMFALCGWVLKNLFVEAPAPEVSA
jgi:exosortase